VGGEGRPDTGGWGGEGGGGSGTAARRGGWVGEDGVKDAARLPLAPGACKALCDRASPLFAHARRFATRQAPSSRMRGDAPHSAQLLRASSASSLLPRALSLPLLPSLTLAALARLFEGSPGSYQLPFPSASLSRPSLRVSQASPYLCIFVHDNISSRHSLSLSQPTSCLENAVATHAAHHWL